MFERAECSNVTGSNVTVHCDVRNLSHEDITANLWLNFSEPTYDTWVHAVFYYRYNGHSYSSFPIDLWENVCAWLNGTHKYFFLNIIKNPIKKFSNMNHSCPYTGIVAVNMERVNLNKHILTRQFLPSGRYRLDIDFTRTYKKDLYASGKIFFAISDNRVEVF